MSVFVNLIMCRRIAFFTSSTVDSESMSLMSMIAVSGLAETARWNIFVTVVRDLVEFFADRWPRPNCKTMSPFEVSPTRYNTDVKRVGALTPSLSVFTIKFSAVRLNHDHHLLWFLPPRDSASSSFSLISFIFIFHSSVLRKQMTP